MASNQTDTPHNAAEEETSSPAYAETTLHDTLNLDLQWDGPIDPDNPRNWPVARRAVNSTIILSVGLLSSFASSVLVPAVPEVMNQFDVPNNTIGALTTSLYVLGLGFGPFVLAPLSELYGRWIVYTSTLAVYTILQMACALSNSMTLLIVFRLLAGLTGGMAPSLGQASISDLWDVTDRGRWAAMLTLGPTLGPPVGSLVGALILSGKTWPWIFWIIMILSGVMLFLTTVVLRETYGPVILRKRQRKRLITAGHSTLEKPLSGTLQGEINEKQANPPDPAQMLGRAITRPLRFLGTSPILVIFSSFLAYIFGMMYLLLTSMPLLFGRAQSHPSLFNYHFNSIGTGLSYLGLATGFCVGCMLQVHVQPRIWNYLTKRNGENRPEYRLLPMTVGMLLFPVSLLWYGWSSTAGSHWISPVIATGFFGLGTFITFQSIHVYLAEAFIPYSASAIGAATLMRCITGAVFPLFGEQLFTHLGYGRGGTLLAALALPAIPLPWLLYKHGNYLRKRWEFSP